LRILPALSLVLGTLALSGLVLGTPVSAASAPSRWWVWLVDKGPGVAGEDAPVYQPYLSEVAKVARVHHVTRWFNGVSVAAGSAEVAQLRALPFVKGVAPVGRWRRGYEPEGADAQPPKARPARPTGLNYGDSSAQMHMIGADSLHALGLTGQGILIAVLDNGFDDLQPPAFSRLTIVAKHDFIDGDADVGGGSHGTEVLSCLAGYDPGSLIGPAYGAKFLLARTENDSYERPIEEDNWVAAAEWAASLGAQIISSSIGYNYFENDPAGNWSDSSYTVDQLDGKTALITRAAQKAASRGIIVVNCAGNERGYYEGVVIWKGKLLMPADGDSVIAVGAVNYYGSVAGFSSVGPTADGRIKPDVAAPGVGVMTAYGYDNGTSFATPLVSGLAAQLLQAHPNWDPIAVRTALRLSGSRALLPDTLAGWGVVDGVRALAADSAIFGRMVDIETGEPVPGSYVRVYDSGQNLVGYAAASAAGWYRCERLQPGTYRVLAFRATGEAVAETTLALPMLPRETHLPLRKSISVAEGPSPAGLWVSQPLPNPANPATTIRFRLPDPSPGQVVRLNVRSLTGQVVRELIAPAAATGMIAWDGRDRQGRAVASGVYLAEVRVGSVSVIRRVVVLR